MSTTTNDPSEIPIRYTPPAIEDVDRYARDVCARLAGDDQPVFLDPEVISGLSGFLNMMTELIAKQANAGNTEFLDGLSQKR